MSSQWTAVVIAGIVAVASVVGAALRIAFHDGQLNAILQQLTQISADHEIRIRDLEKPPARRVR